jgi:hypothetical protein
MIAIAKQLYGAKSYRNMVLEVSLADSSSTLRTTEASAS